MKQGFPNYLIPDDDMEGHYWASAEYEKWQRENFSQEEIDLANDAMIAAVRRIIYKDTDIFSLWYIPNASAIGWFTGTQSVVDFVTEYFEEDEYSDVYVQNESVVDFEESLIYPEWIKAVQCLRS